MTDKSNNTDSTILSIVTKEQYMQRCLELGRQAIVTSLRTLGWRGCGV